MYDYFILPSYIALNIQPPINTPNEQAMKLKTKYSGCRKLSPYSINAPIAHRIEPIIKINASNTYNVFFICNKVLGEVTDC